MSKIKEEEHIYLDYSFDFRNRFVSEGYRLVRDGDVCFVYKKEVLDEITALLDAHKIKYNIQYIEDYWSIVPTGKRRHYDTDKKK